MIIEGNYKIPLGREIVWDAIVDPVVLQACIPGCSLFVENAENEFSATIRASIGPVSSDFMIALRLSDMNPPESCRITGLGKGRGAVGFAQGSTSIVLAEAGGDTELRYRIDTKVGGKLAQVGSRLIEKAAQKVAEEFFSKLTRHLCADAGLEAGGNTTEKGSLYLTLLIVCIVLLAWYFFS